MNKQDLIYLSNSKIYLARIERMVSTANLKQLKPRYKLEKEMFKNYGFTASEMKGNSILKIFKERLERLKIIKLDREINQEIYNELQGAY